MNSHRLAVITGATSGIGLGTLKSLVKDHEFEVIASGRNHKKLIEIESELNQSDKRLVHAFCADVAYENLMVEIFTYSKNEFGRSPDTIVLSAGVGLPGTLLTADANKWSDLIHVNYLSQLHHLRVCAQLMQKDDTDKLRDIVFIGSVAGREISAANPVYGSTKVAMHYIIESLRRDLAASGIRVSLIEPGFVKSDFQKNAGYDSEWFNSIEEQYGPLLEPADIADAVSYIISRPKHIHIDDLRIRPTRQRI